MPLVLTLRAGESLYINDEKFSLTRIVSKDKVRMMRHRDKTLFELTVKEGVEIDDDVIAQLGDRITSKVARIAIDAPRSKLILSEDKYGSPRKAGSSQRIKEG
jgi:sRNA-binding carbon storage regulator CsrA